MVEFVTPEMFEMTKKVKTIEEIFFDNHKNGTPRKYIFDAPTIPNIWTNEFIEIWDASYKHVKRCIDSRVLLLYGSRKFIEVSGKYNDSVYVTANFTNSLQDIFWSWVSTNESNLIKIYNAIMEEYNPLENYNGQSTLTTTESGKEIDTNNIGVGKVTSTANTVPQDVLTERETNKNVTQSDAQTNKNTKEFDGRTTTVTENRHGNLGVTRSQEMLMDEYNIRWGLDFAMSVISRFIMEMTF